MALTRITNNMLPTSVSLTNVTATNLKATNLQDTSGNTAMSVSKVSGNAGRYIRQCLFISDTTDRSTTTSWTAGSQFDNIGTFKAGSLLKIYYMYPCRNDSTGWGGLYFEPQLAINGTWYTLGSRGYDAVMHNNSADIHWTDNLMLVDPGQSADFTASIRFYFRSYDGTVGLNNGQGHDINAVSGTAGGGWLGGNNNNQHYGHWIVEEMAILRGAS
jgi:hypothetical protein